MLPAKAARQKPRRTGSLSCIGARVWAFFKRGKVQARKKKTYQACMQASSIVIVIPSPMKGNFYDTSTGRSSATFNQVHAVRPFVNLPLECSTILEVFCKSSMLRPTWRGAPKRGRNDFVPLLRFHCTSTASSPPENSWTLMDGHGHGVDDDDVDVDGSVVVVMLMEGQEGVGLTDQAQGGRGGVDVCMICTS